MRELNEGTSGLLDTEVLTTPLGRASSAGQCNSLVVGLRIFVVDCATSGLYLTTAGSWLPGRMW